MEQDQGGRSSEQPSRAPKEADWLLEWAQKRESFASRIRLGDAPKSSAQSAPLTKEEVAKALGVRLESFLTERMGALSRSGLLSPGFDALEASVELVGSGSQMFNVGARCAHDTLLSKGHEWARLEISAGKAMDFEGVWKELSAEMAALDAIHSQGLENPTARALIEADALGRATPKPQKRATGLGRI